MPDSTDMFSALGLIRTVVALLVAMGVSVVAAIVFGLIAGHLTLLTAAAALICGAGNAIYILKRVPLSAEPTRASVLDWFVIVCFGLFALRAFGWLLFVDGEDYSILSENNFSDMPLHLTFINYLARGPSFWPDNPIYSGLKLHYPIGTDLFNALLKMIGLNEIFSLTGVGLMASLITCIALYQWGKGFALAGFLFSGGTAGFSFFSDLWTAFASFCILSIFHSQSATISSMRLGKTSLWPCSSLSVGCSMQFPRVCSCCAAGARVG